MSILTSAAREPAPDTLLGAPIIQMTDVSFTYPGAQSASLQKINLTIERGEFIAIAGTNGSGKSTLCKCLNGLIPNYYVGDLTGEIKIAGLNAAEESVASLSRKTAYVFQDFENQLVRPTVYDEVMFAPLNYGYPDYRDRGSRALAMLGIDHLKDQWIWQLSGGQKHLTALAGALSLDPDIIIVDEPVAQLDPYHARLIYDKLKLLNEKHGKTIIVIEHHTEFIADYCNRVILMDSGRIRSARTTREALSAVEELESLHILPPQVTLAVRSIEAKRQADDAHPPAPKLYPVTIAEAAAYFSSIAIAAEPEANNTQHAALEETAPASVVQFRNVSYGYKTITRKRHPVLRDISLSLHEGERIALVGNNGAGKSTLLKLISGIRRPNEGQIDVCGYNTRATSPEMLSDHVSYIYQNPEEMFIEDTIRKDVEYFLKARHTADRQPFIDELMERLHLLELQERDGRLLSGGQQRRATLAIGLAMRPTVMLLDEPTASLDAASRREMTAMLSKLKDRVRTVVIATHDMQLVAEWANRVIVMHNGQIALDTSVRALFSRVSLLNQAGLISPQITQLSVQLGMSPPCLSVEEFAQRFNSRKPISITTMQEEEDIFGNTEAKPAG